jgi:hypothetical protein
MSRFLESERESATEAQHLLCLNQAVADSLFSLLSVLHPVSRGKRSALSDQPELAAIAVPLSPELYRTMRHLFCTRTTGTLASVPEPNPFPESNPNRTTQT